MNVLAAVEKIIMYIPVAEATVGGQPILNSSGLKIEPPPSPRAPDTHPPKNEANNNLNKLEPWTLISELTSP